RSARTAVCATGATCRRAASARRRTRARARARRRPSGAARRRRSDECSHLPHPAHSAGRCKPAHRRGPASLRCLVFAAAEHTGHGRGLLVPPTRRTSATRGRTRRRVRKNIAIGQAHIKTSFNNTIVALTDKEGNVIVWESAGSAGFKGSRKSTPFAAQVTADAAARKGMEHGLQKVEVFVKGPGSGRETAIRSLQAAGLEILGVKDVSPQAHNGVRQKKRRRV